MNISALCIRRPVLAAVLNLIVVALGLYFTTALQVRQLPRVVLPVVTVRVMLPGASPAVVERQLATPLEEAISTVPGIQTMSSSSGQGIVVIQLRFAAGVDPASAASLVRDQVAAAQARLPQGTQPATVVQASADGQAVLYLAASDPQRSEMEITAALKLRVLPRLSALPGVAQASLTGERPWAIRVRLDPARMAAYGITADEIPAAFAQQNVDLPGGQVDGPDTILGIELRGTAADVEQLAAMVLRSAPDGTSVRLSDVATVAAGGERPTTGVRRAGGAALSIGLVPQPGANPLEIGRAVRAMLPALQGQLPEGMRLDLVFDTSIFIEAAVHEVVSTILIAIGIVLLVVLVFLGSLRSSLVALAAIPVSLIGSVAAMAALGFTINTFSMLALILAVGLVVDDAIVEVENVQRHVDEGLPPVAAALRGSDEIGFAVIATTLTLASVFAPLGLAGGIIGQMLSEFALTLVAAILLSGFVARTFAPALAARLLRPTPRRGYAAMVARAELALAAGYRRLLDRMLRLRWPIPLLLAGCVALGWHGATRLPLQVSPTADDAFAMIRLEAPPAASLDYLGRWASRAEQAIRAEPEVSDALMLLGIPSANQVLALVVYKPWSERHRTSGQIGDAIMNRLQALPGVTAARLGVDPLAGGSPRRPLQLVLETDGSYDTLAAAARAVSDAARGSRTLRNVTSDLQAAAPRVVVEVDRDVAARLGIDVASVGRALNLLLGGQRISTFSEGSELYNILAEVPLLTDDPGAYGRVHLRAPGGALVPLATLVKVREEPGPATLTRLNRARAATLGADLAPGARAAEGMAELRALARQYSPAEVRLAVDAGGQAAAQAGGGLASVAVLALLFIYLLLAAQFESFRAPFVVLLAVPFGICGALAGLAAWDGSLNTYSAVGLIALLGMIAKHGILITEFANQLRHEGGLPKREAVLEAASRRLRAILMTTAGTVLGAVPLAMAAGADAATRSEIGIVIVAGMTLGTVVSLFLVPGLYLLLTPRTAVPEDPRAGAEAKVAAAATGPG